MSEIQQPQWYVVHTYSGHENKVKATIEKAVKTRGMEDCIKSVIVPTEDVIETTKVKEKVKEDGKVKEVIKEKTKVRQRKIYPSYVLIKMIITDESWYIVRNTKGVTGFVGPGSKPVPLTDEEVEAMGISESAIEIDLEVGESVKVIYGPLKEFVAIIQEINLEKHKMKALIDMFGRETLAELDFNQVEKLV